MVNLATSPCSHNKLRCFSDLREEHNTKPGNFIKKVYIETKLRYAFNNVDGESGHQSWEKNSLTTNTIDGESCQLQQTNICLLTERRNDRTQH